MSPKLQAIRDALNKPVYKTAQAQCQLCGTVHKEVFPIPKKALVCNKRIGSLGPFVVMGSNVPPCPGLLIFDEI